MEQLSKSTQWLIRFGLLFFGTSVSLALGELTVRLLAPQDDLAPNSRVLAPRGYFVHQAGGTSLHAFNGRRLTYRFNEHRLRGGTLGEGRPRVLVLGDSFTFGYLVKEEHTYAGRLAAYSDRDLGPGTFEFLNGGTEGWGAADYLAFLEDYGETLAPQAVLVFYNFDDIGRASRSGLYILDDEQTLELKAAQRPIDFRSAVKRFLDSTSLYSWMLEHSHQVRLLRNTVARIRLFQDQQAIVDLTQSAVSESAAEQFDREAVLLGQAIFRRLKRWSNSHNAQLLVVTTGFHLRHVHQEEFRPGNLAFWEQASEFFEREGIPFKDISPEVVAILQDRWEDYVIPEDGHPNEASTELTTGLVWDWLENRLRELSEDLTAASPRSL